MMQCLKCGSNIEDQSNFCPYCGCNLTTNMQESSYFVIKHKSREVSLLLALFLPGFSYFYLGLFKRGILYFLSFVIILFILPIKAGFYGNIVMVNSQVLLVILSIFSLCIYLYQIYDVIQKTKYINSGLIRYLK